MVQVAMLVFAFPFGAARWSRRAALCATAGLYAATQVVQTLTTPQRREISYWVVQALTALLAYGLVAWGHRWGARRRAARPLAATDAS